LKAPTALGISNWQTTTYCYNCSKELKSSNISAVPCCLTMRFCSAECRIIAKEAYHKTLCSKDFGIMYKEAETAQDIEDPALHALFWLRLLVCCVQDGNHPLETPWMAILVAQYEADENIGWSFRANVVAPLKILKSIGTDIYADARYDSWILKTMCKSLQATSEIFLSQLTTRQAPRQK
jgi:hypothetical protein